MEIHTCGALLQYGCYSSLQVEGTVLLHSVVQDSRACLSDDTRQSECDFKIKRSLLFLLWGT